MAMWSRLGTGLPTCSRCRPCVKRAPTRSRADTNWDEAAASMTRCPPSTAPVPCTVKGREPVSSSSTVMPRPRSDSMMAPIGRCRACGSPSKDVGPSRRAASGGTNRITVPASPQSTCRADAGRAGSWEVRGVGSGSIWRSGPYPPVPEGSLTMAPSDRMAVTMRAESLECRGSRSTLGPSASAARTR